MKVRWLAGAIRDLRALRNYIAVDNPPAASATSERIIEATSKLESFPAVGRVGRVAGTRELVIDGTPYIVPYRQRGETIEILKVIHSARKWPMRF